MVDTRRRRGVRRTVRQAHTNRGFPNTLDDTQTGWTIELLVQSLEDARKERDEAKVMRDAALQRENEAKAMALQRENEAHQREIAALQRENEARQREIKAIARENAMARQLDVAKNVSRTPAVSYTFMSSTGKITNPQDINIGTVEADAQVQEGVLNAFLDLQRVLQNKNKETTEEGFTKVAVPAIEALFDGRADVGVHDTSKTPLLDGQKPDITIVAKPVNILNALNVAAVVELKRPSPFLDNACKGQTINYGLRILELNPRRQFVFCVLWNGILVQFFKVTRTVTTEYASQPGNFVNDRGHVDPNHVFLRFARLSLEDMGVVELPDFSSLVPGAFVKEYISEGATAHVYLVEGEGQMVAKCLKDDHQIKAKKVANIEVEILRALTEVEGVPKVEAYKDNILILSPYASDKITLSARFFGGLVDILSDVHSKGYCHRDIRVPNVLEYAGTPLLVDWGFAVPLSDDCCFEGGLATASDRVLKLAKDGKDSYKPHPEDDLVSLVRFAICATFPWVRENIPSPYSNSPLRSYAEDVLDYWGKVPVWPELYEAAYSVNYDKLKSVACRLLPP